MSLLTHSARDSLRKVMCPFWATAKRVLMAKRIKIVTLFILLSFLLEFVRFFEKSKINDGKNKKKQFKCVSLKTEMEIFCAKRVASFKSFILSPQK